MSLYEVICGNIGKVYTGTDARVAEDTYRTYKELAEMGVGRAAGEAVTMFQDGSIVKEHASTLNEN